MKNIVLLSTILFVAGCSFQQAEIIEPEEIVNVEVESAESITLKSENIKLLQTEKKVEEPKSPEEKKMELKRKLDQEALTNADKKLKAEEVRDYKIDENTPLILINQSEDKAYE